MADKFPNLPGISVGIQDGNLLPDAVPAGPTVVILGTATKGPSKVESRLVSPTTALARFGLAGTLARGCIEAFQGGADNAIAYRVLATEGRIEHIGDVTGVAGYTIETVGEGSDILEKLSVLYVNSSDLLKVYDVASGAVVFSNDPDAPVDLGVVTVTGSKADGNTFGSIGLQVKVHATETSQTFTTDDGAPTVITLVDGCNLALLKPITAANAYVAQLQKSNGTVIAERAVSGFDAVARTVTLASAIDVDAGNFAEGASHKVRFISTTKPIRADKILTNRLNDTDDGESLRVTPGSDFNGLPKITNDGGLTVDSTLDEVAPAKMNMYEALEDAFGALEASSFSQIVMPGVYLDDPALDGEDEGETALPSVSFTAPTVATVAGFADRCHFTFADEAAKDAALVILAAAGRGGVWVNFTTAQGSALGDTFGFGFSAGEVVRTARILNWEEVDDDTLLVFFDREVGFSLDEDDLVEGSEAPVVRVFTTDQLFYHRSVEVDGELKHFWYPELSDADGYTYNEVNFGYRLAKFCHEMMENETSVTGVIGVRPPTNHYNPAAIATWIGKSPAFDEDGNVSTNGTGLLGNKFISGKLMADSTQFSPGFKATESGELDDDEILLDKNNFEVDMGKFLSVVASWPVISNEADQTGLGYINSGAALYAGKVASLPSWRGTTAKAIGGRNCKLAAKLAKRHQNSLTGSRYVLFDQRPEGVIVVDGPSFALPTSDFTRNMTVRLTAEAVQLCRNAARPFLGDPLDALKFAALQTAILKTLSDLQRISGGALESYTANLTQSQLDKRSGKAKLTLTLQIINELRKISVDVALTK